MRIRLSLRQRTLSLARRTSILLASALLGLSLSEVSRAQSGTPGSEDFNKGGRTSFQFVKIGVGARQAALGEAAIASVRDLTSIYWNPAGITGIDRFEAAFSYTRWLADMNYVAAATGGRLGNLGTFAITMASLDYGDIPEAVLGAGSDGRTGQSFSGGDLFLGLFYARQFNDNLSIGVGVKYLHETLWEYSAGTFAFDVGTTYQVGFRGLTLAMAAQNFAGAVSFRGEESDREEGYSVPLVFRIGVAGNLIGGDAFFPVPGPHRVVASLEAINTNDFSERLHLGAEYIFNDLLAIRGGYRVNYAEGNWSVGLGFTPPEVSGVRLRADYAYVGYEFLTAPHRFTVSLAF
jgi:long-subunit fatty acid transport protein